MSRDSAAPAPTAILGRVTHTERTARVVELRHQGMRLVDIAAELDVSLGTIKRTLSSAGVRRNRTCRKEPEPLARYVSGKDRGRVARLARMDPYRVGAIARGYCIPSYAEVVKLSNALGMVPCIKPGKFRRHYESNGGLPPHLFRWQTVEVAKARHKPARTHSK